MEYERLYAPLLRPSELLQRLNDFPVIYLPIGSIEWHNEHLPLGTDTFHAGELCFRLAEELGGVVMPAFWWNTGDCHRHLSTYYLQEELYEAALESICMGFSDMPCRLLALVNGHGGKYQNQYMEKIPQSLNRRKLHYKVISIDPYHQIQGCPYRIDHADTVETSLSMELIPELVKMENQIGEDLYSHKLPFSGGLPNRKMGEQIWEVFRKEAAAVITEALGK